MENDFMKEYTTDILSFTNIEYWILVSKFFSLLAF